MAGVIQAAAPRSLFLQGLGVKKSGKAAERNLEKDKIKKSD